MQNVKYQYQPCTIFQLVADSIGKKIKSATALYFRACLRFKEFYFVFGFATKLPETRSCAPFFGFPVKFTVWYEICNH
ncbi:hypothetical protein CH375_15490 [Leptospira ellisii]|uniref:Uncharacterized protein n=1 Tax=Leptospira ellisii TaxID=2023197 RepID=A0A2N0B885_9LEPT|nr:hypothetical protein CH379_11370 [Leptospira ellisii]PKA03691.1 hypothetical protein CH375_15490 [Leptospira ellisii]